MCVKALLKALIKANWNVQSDDFTLLGLILKRLTNSKKTYDLKLVHNEELKEDIRARSKKLVYQS